MGRIFPAYGTPLTAVPSFKYLGRTLSSSDENWPTVEQNIWRARGGVGATGKDFGKVGIG